MHSLGVWWRVAACAAMSLACEESDDAKSGDDQGVSGSAENGENGHNGDGAGGASMVWDDSGGGEGGVVGMAGGPGACATDVQTTELRTVYLAFMFDRSGSMGELDFPWHDPELKWDPVVAATTAFLENPDFSNIHAAMTLFPDDGADRCYPDRYSTFDIPMTALPSDAFRDLLVNQTTPTGGGTPTLGVIEGTLEQILPASEADPGAQYVMVLVTDGVPQGCDDNSFESIESALSGVAARVPTYVIGVENPPIEDAPENVSALHAFAEAGGTGTAFIIETGDPQATTAALLHAIESIRDSSISCNVAIPRPPTGQVLNPRRVRVSYTAGGDVTVLDYDPDCASDTSWHYDDVDQPTEIQLCSVVCDTVRAQVEARLEVEFACEDVITVL